MANCVVAGDGIEQFVECSRAWITPAGSCRNHWHSTFHMHTVKNVGQVVLENIKKKVKFLWEVVVEEFREIRGACGRCL